MNPPSPLPSPPTTQPTPVRVLQVQTCPRAYPYRCTGRWSDQICFSDAASARRCHGPARSWCALPNYTALTDISSYIANHDGTTCASLHSCPEAYPYRCSGNWNGLICFNDVNLAKRCQGPDSSWCALRGYASLSDINSSISTGRGAACASLARRCPPAFPYRCTGKWKGLICYNDAIAARKCTGPARSWCALPGFQNLSEVNSLVSDGQGSTCELAQRLQSCPLAYPYRCNTQWDGRICYNDLNSAAACNGPYWCALPGYRRLSQISDMVSDGRGLACASSCPPAYSHRCTSKWNGLICFKHRNSATRCSGPHGSWCALPGYADVDYISSLFSVGKGMACA